MNISKKARALALLLGMLMLFACFATSCANDDEDDPQNTQQTTTAPKVDDGDDEKEANIESWLPIRDYGVAGGVGQVNYLIYDTYANKYMLVQHEDSEDPLRSQAYSRTQKVEEKFNIYLNVLEETDCAGKLQASVMGQGGEYDIIYPAPGQQMTMLENNLLTDLMTYENIHTDEPWWNQSVETFTFNDRLYFAAADYSICGQGLVGLIYNRDLFKDLQLDRKYDINKLVEDKEWTMEVLREIAMQHGDDLNNDDKYTLDDSYGMIYQNYHTNGYYWSMGGTVVTKDENGNYDLSISLDRCSKMADALYDLVYSSDNKVYVMPNCSWSQFETSDGWKAYKKGDSLFMSFEFGALFTCLQSVSFDLGYAPLPLLDTDQEDYYSLCGAGFFMIPKKSSDPERNSIILEALCIDSYANFRPTFFKTVLLGRLANMEEDYAMLERLHESKVYDLGYSMAQGGSNSILASVIESKNKQIASMVRGHWSDMKKIIENIDDLCEGLYD